ncbi:MAG: hypothetical protein QF805_09410, partial [Pirellulaceae bacterium]|nr:hypothetical protein [Pirellulaceae bacterium]
QTIFARVVNASDQRTRLKIAFYSLLVCLLVGVIANLNRTCLHGVYRDQIGEIWLPRLNMKLSELDTCSKGAPLHLFNGTVNRMGNRN